MPYQKLFDPQPLFQDFRTDAEKAAGMTADHRDGKIYAYTEPLVLAINVALATGRPLLLRGSPGCGKSSVAYNIARVLGRPYYENVITSRMGAHDLMWRFDAVRRLGDAQVGRQEDGNNEVAPWTSYYPYIEPEVLWWVFDGTSAERRGLSNDQDLFFQPAVDPVIFRPATGIPNSRAVILLDEIDKAEPDVPNNLLVAMGSFQFQVKEIQRTIALQSGQADPVAAEDLPLIVITTNEERQLPAAFLRRCIVYRFELPEPPDLVPALVALAENIEGGQDTALYTQVANSMQRLAAERTEATREAFNPSIAEYLDAVRACRKLRRKTMSQQVMDDILERTTWKNPSRH